MNPASHDHPTTTIGARLDRLPLTRFHSRLLVAGGLGYAFDALDVGIIAFLLPSLKAEWGLSAPLMGLLAAGSSIGGFVGALGSGLVADRIGRKAVILWALAIYCTATFGCALADRWSLFLLFRVIAGVGTSAESAIIAPYLTEFAGTSFRGRYVGTLTAFFSIGFLLSAILGFFIVPVSPSAWRVVLVVAALPIMTLLWWRRALPESPRWLVERGRLLEAESIVSEIELECEAAGLELAPPYASHPSVEAGEGGGGLASDNIIRRAAMTVLMWFAIGFCYYAFFTWIPALLVGQGMTIARSFGFSIVIYGAQLPGFLISAYANDLVGRRLVIALNLALAAVAAAALALSSAAAVMVISAAFLSFFMNGTYAGVYTYTAELFPTRIRATMQGIAGSISRIGAAISPIVVGILYPKHGLLGVFGMTAAILVSAALAPLLLGRETRGRSLEIAASSENAVKQRRADGACA